MGQPGVCIAGGGDVAEAKASFDEGPSSNNFLQSNDTVAINFRQLHSL
jgi:hypothetical protein